MERPFYVWRRSRAVRDLFEAWRQNSMRTDPIDIKQVRESINQCYVMAECKPPNEIVRVNSIVEFFDFLSELKSFRKQWLNCADKVWNQHGQFAQLLCEQQLLARRFNQIDVVYFLHGQTSVRMDQVGVLAAEIDALNSHIEETGMYFYHDTSDKLDFCTVALGNALRGFNPVLDTICEDFRIDLPLVSILATVTKIAHRWVPFEDLAVVFNRPRNLRFDDHNRLHCADGPAIEWRDGLEIYMWHGQQVPKTWIDHKDNLDFMLKYVLNHSHMERRRAGLFMLLDYLQNSGMASIKTVFDQIGCTTLDVDPNPMIGTLVELYPSHVGFRVKLLLVTCGTGREFAIRVPPESPSAKWANAWTYGMQHDLQNFQPRLRT